MAPRTYRLEKLTKKNLGPVWATRTISVKSIADKLGVSENRLREKAFSLGLPRRGNNSPPRGSTVVFTAMWKAGVSRTDIAKHFGYAFVSTVRARCRKLGLPTRERIPGSNLWPESMPLDEFLAGDCILAEHMKNDALKRFTPEC